MQNLSFVAFNDSEGKSRMNMTFTLLTELEKATVSFDFREKSHESLSYFDNTVMTSRVDSCKMGQGVLGNLFVKILMVNIEKFSNLLITCPFKKGFYYIYNLPSIDDSFYPPFVQKTYRPWLLNIVIKSKVARKPKYFMLTTLKLYGKDCLN